MKIKPFFRFYDIWIGLYIDIPNRAIYICPIPMFGVKIQLTPKPKSEKAIYKIIHKNEDFTYAQDKDGRVIMYSNNQIVDDEFFSDDTHFLFLERPF